MTGGAPDRADGFVWGPRHRLFSAAAAIANGAGSLAAFYAATAPDADAFRRALELRIGGSAAEDAVIVVGFDAHDRLVRAMLGPETKRLLRWAADHPGSILTDGLEIQHFQLLGSSGWPAA